eukprot:CAMPEP_0202456414 /NCGR_PEP_ID=MMETSP1360-20130828/13670_1 /ASSEMBLY_ACC=CAM_ASM_000848 /TAXON_ID=515479 /ORGANISM="Licmophora paradoxa, Strain CCMP2313" /LENGTH=373 /DNA_ID=CAMNT_0049076203 /DNA_START=225 /DNA_END=1346 /DNA_ORIENTATION=+
MSTSVNGRTTGILVLLTVPLAWGTYTPAVKYLYELQPAVPGFVFSAAYYVVASIVLISLVVWNEDDFAKDLPIRGGLELGLYLFIGNAFQVIGLKTIPSDRAGFIVQLTTVMVPLMQALIYKVAIPLKVAAACLMAFAGVIVMGLDGKEFGTDSFGAIETGDLLIVCAAFFYTLHVVRLSRYVQDSTPLKLAATKAMAEAFLSISLVSIFLGASGVGDSISAAPVVAARDAGVEISTFFSDLQSGLSSGTVTLATMTPAIGAVLWTGLVTCAYTIYAQSFGQSRVSATEANLIYTAQPLFTSLFAFFLLGETLGSAGIGGAILIGSALFVVSSDENTDDTRSLQGNKIPEEAVDSESITVELEEVRPLESVEK